MHDAAALHRTCLAYAASVWAALFALLHVFWSVAFFWWPAAGIATLGDGFIRAFARPWTHAYDLIVAVLFAVAALLAFAVTRPQRGGIPLWVLAAGLPTAGTLLFLRGAAGVVVVTLALLDAIERKPSVFMLYDFWFLLGGTLFLGLALASRRTQPMTDQTRKDVGDIQP